MAGFATIPAVSFYLPNSIACHRPFLRAPTGTFGRAIAGRGTTTITPSTLAISSFACGLPAAPEDVQGLLELLHAEGAGVDVVLEGAQVHGRGAVGNRLEPVFHLSTQYFICQGCFILDVLQAHDLPLLDRQHLHQSPKLQILAQRLAVVDLVLRPLLLPGLDLPQEVPHGSGLGRLRDGVEAVNLREPARWIILPRQSAPAFKSRIFTYSGLHLLQRLVGGHRDQQVVELLIRVPDMAPVGALQVAVSDGRLLL